MLLLGAAFISFGLVFSTLTRNQIVAGFLTFGTFLFLWLIEYAESWAGARGLMQLMPATAKEQAGKLGRVHRPAELFDPEYSILLGTSYFRWVLDRFDGNVELALAGYNGGPNRIRRLWREAGPDP